MPLDIAVSRQYGDSTVTLRTNLPVTTGKGPVPLATAPMTTEAPAGGGVGRLVSTASFFGDEGVPRASSFEQAMGTEEARVSTAIGFDRCRRTRLLA
jgi:inorganic pyrophosphatase